MDANEIVEVLLAEGPWANRLKMLAAAGLVAGSTYAGLQHANVIKRASAPTQDQWWIQRDTPHRQVPTRVLADPNKPLPGEEKLNDWEYTEKKARERQDVAQKLKGFTDRYVTNQPRS